MKHPRPSTALHVAINCLKNDRDKTNPALIEALEQFAKESTERERVFDAHAEQKRIEHQRAMQAKLNGARSAQLQRKAKIASRGFAKGHRPMQSRSTWA